MTNLPTKTALSGPSMLMDPQSFDQLYRVGKMLASSIMFPEHLRKGSPEQAAANGALVMNMAMRLNEDALAVAQNIVIVSGKPGWASTYLISKANQHGVFKDGIDWVIEGRGTDNLSVTAYAQIASTGKKVQFTCDMKMAKAEGWTRNSKYQSMPEVMLRYRSATFLIRFYCPEVMIGVPAQVELEMEMRDVTPQDFNDRTEAPKTSKAAEPEDAVVVQDSADHDPETGEVKADAKEPVQEPRTESAQTAGKPANQPDPSQFQGLYEMIKRDLLDAPSVDDVEDLYADQIKQMQASAPDLHKSLVEEFEAYRKAQS